MKKFIQDSLRELRHVVWPTHKETQKYFFLVLAILVLFGLYLFIFSNVFSNIILTLRDVVQGNTTENTQELNTDFLDDISISTGEVTPEEENLFQDETQETSAETPVDVNAAEETVGEENPVSETSASGAEAQ